MNTLPPKRILVCPLDWGLGHATRVIPLIHALQGYGSCEVILGVSGSSGTLLRAEFPGLKAVNFPESHIRYSRGPSQIITMLIQLPRLLASFFTEQRQLKKVVARYGISAVISDNRYGLYHKAIPSILIIHQLQLKFPWPVQFLARVANRLQKWCFKRFDQVWVPDLPEKYNLAGELSQLPPSLTHAYPIGLLSRFFYGKPAMNEAEQTWDVLVILSGPEPQRSLLEDIVTRQLDNLKFKTLMVNGVMSEEHQSTKDQITCVSHLLSNDLLKAVKSSRMVVCRAGYSSVMDLTALGKQAVLVPTPGQPEQEYLARHLHDKGWFYYQEQSHLNLEEALVHAERFHPPRLAVSDQLFSRINWLFECLKDHEGEDQHG